MTVAVDVIPYERHEGDDERSMWICRFGPAEPGGWGLHRHEQHQIAWVSEGLTTAVVEDRTWVLPPTRALFVPAHAAHDVVNRPPAALHCLYVWPHACPLDWTAPTVIGVGPLLRELMLALSGPALQAVEESARTLFFGLVGAVTDPGVAVPLPDDRRARAVAQWLVSRPDDPRGLDELAPAAGTSVSTLRRAFAETGMTFTDWRTQVRLQAALPHLADGMPVAGVARRVGYASLNGFVDAFRRHFGHTPAAHFTRAPDR
ncbi:helix-turn-helix domain-containing protein [Pseudonocardia sp. WMMC193]|uniref:helix-turn-helix transcriptional regulator n=1 Tax=Pseudonocardia sp. WMMC193 TaxID=2911965 RepID=UPI001F46D1BC|nr:helix-turn-helix transcriptional regulator [Pseudonocardia sp. WMMC193]MCF7550069.1 helix-turn-helix transcriptional regulator [Pseudonocardia sp. WMMC193]